MKTIQAKIKEIEATGIVSDLSLCNIHVLDGRAIIANKHLVSSIIAVNPKELDRDVPVATYCIAVPNKQWSHIVGKRIILDTSYGGKGISINKEVTNNEFKLIDVLGGMDNISWEGGLPVISDKTKIKSVSDKLEFWDIYMVSFNQIGGIINK